MSTKDARLDHSAPREDRLARLEQLVIAALTQASRKVVTTTVDYWHCGGCGESSACSDKHTADCWVPLLDAYRREVGR